LVYRDPPRFGLRLITPPTEEPITLGEAMEHLNIPLDVRFRDGWINRNIKTAREWCEGWLGRTLAPQTLELSFGGQTASTAVPSYWQPLALNPWVESGSVIELPMGPALSVTSVTYFDEAGALQTMDAADYVLDDGLVVPTISLASGASWPAIQARRNAIQIRYLAGYTFPDDSPSLFPLPWALRSAILLALGDLYENRENSSPVQLENIPLSAQSLMEPYRLRLGMA